ncbi:hypothetical protein RvY_18314 [Ramazzottius varieornatus]|uniref:Uncharacterized protein n=1 Tax=Ramazzottius varieornatus TaxID=947166 RepID=A0A1D1W5B0_RAMVA|nr:hypothetical protein RvY_18314 [Ramazzottius varieornatus]
MQRACPQLSVLNQSDCVMACQLNQVYTEIEKGALACQRNIFIPIKTHGDKAAQYLRPNSFSHKLQCLPQSPFSGKFLQAFSWLTTHGKFFWGLSSVNFHRESKCSAVHWNKIIVSVKYQFTWSQ